MALYLKSTSDIEALITGSAYAAIAEARKREIATHYEEMLPSTWEPALNVMLTTYSVDEQNFARALFTDAPPAGGSATPAPTPSTSGGGTDFVADIPAIRALDSASLPLGTVRGANKDSGVMGLWRLRAGTDADNPPGILRGHDFDASTNPRVWQERL